MKYSFKCDSCNSVLRQNQTPLLQQSHLTNKCLKNVKQSAISDHSLTCACKINFNDFTTLSKDSNDFNLFIKDGLLIACDKPILNKTVKYFGLELFEQSGFCCCITF